MKQAIILISALAVPAMAEQQTVEEICNDVAEFAEVTMKARQSGVPFGDVFNSVEGEMSKRITMAAYARPRFSTEPYKTNAINDFRDAAHLECIQKIM